MFAFARGEAGAFQRAIEEHLESCRACCAVLAVAARAVDDELCTLVDRPGPAAAPPATPRVGRYELLRPIGRGGMGTVYLARDPELRREVAVKLLHCDQLGPDRQLREAQAMAQLSHGNVVTIHDVGKHAGRIFIAMEYVEGLTLRQWLAAGPRSLDEIVDAFLAAGRGLAAAHTARLIHRDFKPDNVLVGADGRIRVTDFGLARPLELGDEVTRIGPIGLSGTPPYMSPEQLTFGAIDTRSDQYSFCVALYEAIYGVLPFEGTTPAEIVASIERGPRAAPRRAVPAWLRDIVLTGLRVTAAQRYPSMRALLDALARRPSAARKRLAIGAAAAVMLVAIGLVAYTPGDDAVPFRAPTIVLTAPAAVPAPAPAPAPSVTPVDVVEVVKPAPPRRKSSHIARPRTAPADRLDDSLHTPGFLR